MKIILLFIICLGVVQSTDLSTVRYLLWTRSNSEDEDYFDLHWMDGDSLASSPFNGNRRTHFVFHGWTSRPLTGFILNAKTDILEIEDINFISVDWESLAANPLYKPSVSAMYEVANYTAQFIDYLVEVTALTTSNIHIWGNSLGGHACGLTGYYVQSGIIDRVTALDPAGPSFYNVSADRRVDISNAAYVDVIHTNGGSFRYGGKAGLFNAIGHADFYPNGGASQVGCSFQDTREPDVNSGCSHARASKYFVESIKSHLGFAAYPCESWEMFESGECYECEDNKCDFMGYHSVPEKTGIFYLHTNPESPFAIENEP